MKPVNAHDKYFKATFSKKAEAMDLIRHVLPKKLVCNLEFDSLKLDPNSYLDKELKESFSDLVYDCRYSGRTSIKIAILLEHKSTVPDYPHLQILQYFLGIWQTNIKQKQALVPVLPLVVYHGKKKWEYRQFEDYFIGVDEQLAKYLPKFEYLLADLSDYSDEDISKLFDQVSVQIGLRVMKNIFNKRQIMAKLFEIFQPITFLLKSDEGKEFLETTLFYLYGTTDIDKDELIKILKNISEEGGKIAMTTATKLRREGRMEGRMEGKVEGKREGRHETQQEVIVNLYTEQEFSIQKIADILKVDWAFVESTLLEKGVLK